MRERLIHLLRECNTCVNDNCADCKDCFLDGEELCDIHVTADHLLAGGVIVLPCEIEQEVYCISQPCGGCKYYNEPVTEEFINQCRECERYEIIKCGFDYDLVPEFGKTVFPTKEEAERALSQRKEDEGK